MTGASVGQGLQYGGPPAGRGCAPLHLRKGFHPLTHFCGGGMVGLMRLMGGAAVGRRRGGAVRALREGAADTPMRGMAFSVRRWGQEALQPCC